MSHLLNYDVLNSMISNNHCKGIECFNLDHSIVCPAYDITNDCNVMMFDCVLTQTAIKRITKAIKRTVTAKKEAI